MNSEQNERSKQSSQKTSNDAKKRVVKNPFEDGLTAKEDIAQAGEQLDREQEFKEAQTERD